MYYSERKRLINDGSGKYIVKIYSECVAVLTSSRRRRNETMMWKMKIHAIEGKHSIFVIYCEVMF